jgi:hypothetical protein
MRVAADHLGGNRINHLMKGEKIFFLVEVVEEYDLEKEISKFFADVVWVVFVDCLEKFVGFLDKILLEALGSLFFIPRAAVGSPEAADNLKESKEFFRCGCHGLPVLG